MAALDVGSNTLHLLVARLRAGELEARRHAVLLSHLGPHVAAHGRLGPEQVERTASQVAALVALARDVGAAPIRLAATAAVRLAADRRALQAAVRQHTGLPLAILTGEVEARLSFLGATRGAGVAASVPVVVIDLGGGSTEVVLGEGGSPTHLVSLPIGSGLLLREHAFDDPPTPAQRAAATSTIRGHLAGLPPGRPQLAVATGGTAANVPALLGAPRPREGGDGTLRLSPPAPARAARLGLDDLRAAGARTDAEPSAVVAAATGLHPDRVRLLQAGTQLLLAVLEHYRLDALTVTDCGVRDGLLLTPRRAGTGEG
ncbi:MAG TPA: hypothetical protein VMW49_03820 [Candidatus Dormibacteraeota bacterium]|nr:hypothetical protein [Candidatus Dormibacteraeota bacterium]